MLSTVLEYSGWLLLAEVVWWAVVGYIVWSVNRLYKDINEIPIEYE